ncbi:hypothetical protein ACHAWF_017632 [Thalassiosira exigua]
MTASAAVGGGTGGGAAPAPAAVPKHASVPSGLGASSAAAAAAASSSSPPPGDASGVAILLGNHAKFGLAERCCYHFDLMETLTSLPIGRRAQQARARRRDRAMSTCSQEGSAPRSSESSLDAKAPSPKDAPKHRCACGVVSLLECVAGAGGAPADRASKRALRSRHREFNHRAQAAWGRRGARGTKKGGGDGSRLRDGGGGGRRCHQPRHLPLTLSPNTRVAFAYELTSIVILLDASPSLTSTVGVSGMTCDLEDFGEEKGRAPPPTDDGCCVPLDRLGRLIKAYLLGLVKPIAVPPVAVFGLGVAFGRWTPHLAVTVAAAYPPTDRGDRASAGVLVRDFRVTDEASAIEVSNRIERWARGRVEGAIAERMCGDRDFAGDGVAGREWGEGGGTAASGLGSFLPPDRQGCRTHDVKSFVKDMLAVGDAALSSLPPEGRPAMLIATDCRNVHCGGLFESLSETARSDVPVSVLDLSSTPSGDGGSSRPLSAEEGAADSPYPIRRLPLGPSNDSQSLRDMCHLSGGVFLDSSLLDCYVKTTVGSSIPPLSPLQGDFHFSFKKRTIKPNALQWYTLFSLSPFTPGGPPTHFRSIGSLGSAGSSLGLSNFYRSNSTMSISANSATSGKQIFGKPGESANISASTSHDGRFKALGASLDASLPHERVVFAKYNIQPVRIKSLLMTRVLEGYHAKRYGHNTQDKDKVSIHLVLRLDSGILLHYEASFVSSPYHQPRVGQAHIKLELSGGDIDFIQTVKKMYHGADVMASGRRILASMSAKADADKICKLLRWIRKEDYLESYLCLPGWGDINHFAAGSSFLGRLQSLSTLQRFRHFRSETFEIVTTSPPFFEQSESLFSDVMDQSEDAIHSILSDWSTGTITDRDMYFKEIVPAQDDDLAYYCIIRVVHSNEVSRLYTLTCDFHGDINAEQRLSVVASLRENLRACPDIIVLEKCISGLVAIRPVSPNQPWFPCWNEFFLHHKWWELLQEGEVLPLITKRRNEIGNFFILHSAKDRSVFAKFSTNENNVDVVVYQVLSRPDGILVDIHMEASRSTFYPFHARHAGTAFSSIYHNVIKRDKDCAKNIRSRTNLLLALEKERPTSASSISNGTKQADDVLRLIKVSSCMKKRLRFFESKESGTANDFLSQFTIEYITSDSFKTHAAKLSVDQNSSILNYSGCWFIMRVDWYVLSLVCLELRDEVENEEEGGQSFRHLSFFTAGIIDLYQSDDDVSETKNQSDIDPSDVDYGVNRIAEDIENAHAKHFAKALYLALRDTSVPITSLRNDDVTYALSSCFFQKSLQIFVSVDDLSAHLGSSVQTITGTKLAQVIGTLLQVVPGDDNILFYHGAIVDSLDESDDAESGHSEFAPQTFEGGEEENYCASGDNPPLFFRFMLDQQLVSLDDIRALKKSAMLAAEVSVFEARGNLPPSHVAVVSKLQIALESFSSEQILEKYRYMGRSLTDAADFAVVMGNLTLTKQASAEFVLEFYVSRSNSMATTDSQSIDVTDAARSHNTNAEVFLCSGAGSDAKVPDESTHVQVDPSMTVIPNQAYMIDKLMDQLDEAAFTVRASQGSFLVLDESASRDVLPYWCFIQVRKPRGIIDVEIYHPLGHEAAKEQMEVTQTLLIKTLTRTNRLLLLESLYKTKNASSLLICEEDEPADVQGESKAIYSCPVQYQKSIPLHRRCSPKQAILELETTILQNFVISNRRGIFILEDESNNIFYLRLTWSKNEDNEQNSHIIELLVYGCNEPGPSITDQLVCLLRRKLLTLTLDAMSSLLKKNPWYRLLASDLAFIRNFSNSLRELADATTPVPSDCTRIYSLPPFIRDPLVVLLMFRQNICGSTFIQHLHHESSDNEDDEVQIDEDQGTVMHTLRFKKLPDFEFYFNSSPSQLNPHYQPNATLTEKGREYSRQAGSGIAIIDVNVKCCDNSDCEIKVDQKERGIVLGRERLRVRKSELLPLLEGNQRRSMSLEENNDQDSSSGAFKVVVQITNTTVDADVIHKWVELSLSQVIMAWSIERHIESACLGLLRVEPQRSHCETTEEAKVKALNQALPGITVLEDLLKHSSALPHPAIVSVQKETTLRSTILAKLTLDMLEAILNLIVNKQSIFKWAHIVRFTDNDGASLVNITHSEKNSARVELSGERKVVTDKPTDSVEYIAVFGLNGAMGREEPGNSDMKSNHFFKHVNVQVSTSTAEASAFSQALSRLVDANPSLLDRRIALMLKVSRSARTLMTYNVNPQKRITMEEKFNQIEQEAANADGSFRGALQARCLRHISFLRNDSFKQQTGMNEKPTDPTPNKAPEKKPAKEEVKRGPTRRIPRPTSMLRPKLIGKSVEGAAMQARTAARSRASSRPALMQRTATATGKKKATTAKEKTLASERRTSGSQKKVGEQTPKNVGSIVRSSAPQASLVKTYRAFLSLLKESSDLSTSRPRLNQSALQHLAHMFFVASEEKGSTQAATRLISVCYGNFLGMRTVQHLQCYRAMPSAKAFVDYMTKRWGAKSIVPMAGAGHQLPCTNQTPFLYMKKDLLTSPLRRAIILMEVAMPWSRHQNSFIFCCKSWLIHSTDRSKSDKISKKSFARVGRIEREASVMDTIASDFIGQLNLDSELYNFACRCATRSARGIKCKDGPAVLPLLKDIMTRYYSESQPVGYSLQRRFLSPSIFLQGALLDSCKKSALMEHLLSNSHIYNLTCCGSGNEICFAGKLKIVGFLVYYFIAWHESVESALDIFVLCATKGQRIDGYITKEGAPIAERIVDVVLCSTMTVVQDLIEKASKCIRKIHLWQTLGSDYSPSLSGAALSDKITELRKFSHCLDLTDIDSRLEELLCDECKELCLSWRDVLNVIACSSSFSHCITSDEDEASNFFIYCHHTDIFLDFDLDQDGRVLRAQILTREPFEYDEALNTNGSADVRRTVQEFTMFLLQCLWIDSESGL